MAGRPKKNGPQGTRKTDRRISDSIEEEKLATAPEPSPDVAEEEKLATAPEPSPDVAEEEKLATAPEPSPDIAEEEKLATAPEPSPDIAEEEKLATAPEPSPDVAEEEKLATAPEPSPDIDYASTEREPTGSILRIRVWRNSYGTRRINDPDLSRLTENHHPYYPVGEEGATKEGHLLPFGIPDVYAEERSPAEVRNNKNVLLIPRILRQCKAAGITATIEFEEER